MDVFCLHEIYTKIYSLLIIHLLTYHRWTIPYYNICKVVYQQANWIYAYPGLVYDARDTSVTKPCQLAAFI